MAHAVWNRTATPLLYLPHKSAQLSGWERAVWRPVAAHRFFALHWHHSLWVAGLYVALVHGLQRFMAGREARDLRRALLLWNGALALFSTVGAARMGEEWWAVVVGQGRWEASVCLTIDPEEGAALWACLFALSKVAELCDTVFLVLRKKPLIFLHWYHHAVVLVYCWHSALMLTAASRWFITMNYLVHSVMYAYYALSTAGLRLPRSVSMAITTAQTAQMLVGVGISVYVAWVKWVAGRVCHQSDANLWFCFGIYLSFALLFARFFETTYVKRK